MGLFDEAIDAVTSLFDSGQSSGSNDPFSGFDPSAFSDTGETGTGFGALASAAPSDVSGAPLDSIPFGAGQGGGGLGISNAIDQAYKNSWLQSLFGGGNQALSQSTLDAASNPLASGNVLPSAQDEISNGKIAAGLASLNPAAASAVTSGAKGGISTTTLALGALAALGSMLGKQKQPQIPGPGSTAATQGPLFNAPLSGKGANGTFAPVRTPATFPAMTNQDWYTYGTRPALSFYNNNQVGFASGGSVGGRTPAISLTPGGNQDGSTAGGAAGAGGLSSGATGGAGVGGYGYGSTAAAADTSAGMTTNPGQAGMNALGFALGPGTALMGAMANAEMGRTGEMGLMGALGQAIGDALGWSNPSPANSFPGFDEGAFANTGETGTGQGAAAGYGGANPGDTGAVGQAGLGDSTAAGGGFGDTGGNGGADSGGGGGCYITTAAVDHMGLDDKGPELNTLRNFRDKVLAKTPEGQDMIAEYKTVAPHIVKAINARPDATKIYRGLYTDYIAPAVAAAQQGDNKGALDYYGSMVKQLENTFPEKVMAAKGGGVRRERSVFDTDDGEHYVRGGDTGQSDTRNAKLSDGEFVFDAASVSDLGDGNNEAGAKRLEEMRQKIAKHKGRSKVVPPKAKSPLEYLRRAS